MTSPTALVLANGRFRSTWAKTAHGLVRGPSRFPVAAVIDPDAAGADAGELVDGRHRDIPILASVDEALTTLAPRPGVAVVGVATEGGVLTPALRSELRRAALAGLDLVNGLHRCLADEPDLVAAVARGGGSILDFRRPRPVESLRFWTGEILASTIPRLAVLGTDCAVGKRTTAVLLREALRVRGCAAELVTTGQTGWLQGFEHGFFFDATPNDFVAGELEGALLDCVAQTAPQVVLIEGQASLRHPAGPAGAELLVSAAAHGVLLQHDPTREFFDDYESLGCRLPPIAEEIDLIERYGTPVWAVTLNQERLDAEAAARWRARLTQELNRPVFLPLGGDLDRLAEEVSRRVRELHTTVGEGR